jgi:hypothetical protein
LTAAIRLVLVLPPRESRRRKVSLLSRYGTWRCLPEEMLTSAVMTLPSVESDLLMLPASRRRVPSACVSRWRSEPARSMRCSRDARMFFSPPLLDSWFLGVGLWERCFCQRTGGGHGEIQEPQLSSARFS